MGQITRISTKDYLAGARERSLYTNEISRIPVHIGKNHKPTTVEVIREHVDLIENPNSVVLAQSNLLRGTAKSGKKWVRWHDVKKEILTVKPTKAGSMRVNYLVVDRKGFRNFTPYDAMYEPFVNGPAREPIDSLLKRVIPERYNFWKKNDLAYETLFYPGYLHSNLVTPPDYLRPRLRVAMREENAMDMTRAVFGKRHYRKDLVKSLADCTYTPNVELAMSIRNLMKTDWLVEILRHEEVLGYGADFRGGLASIEAYLPRVLSHIPEHRRRRFILSFAGHTRIFNTDALSMGTLMAPEAIAGIRTIAEMHEIGVRNIPARQTTWLMEPDPVDIELTERSKMYDGLETEQGLRIVAPTTSEILTSWSQLMHNCISGYATEASKGFTNLGAVYDGDKLIANFEIDPKGNLRQLLGKYNNHLDISLQGDIIDVLDSSGAVDTGTLDQAWGVDLITVPRRT